MSREGHIQGAPVRPIRLSSRPTFVPNWLQRIQVSLPVSLRLGQKSGQKKPTPLNLDLSVDLLASRRGGTHTVATQRMVHDTPLDGDLLMSTDSVQGESGHARRIASGAKIVRSPLTGRKLMPWASADKDCIGSSYSAGYRRRRSLMCLGRR